MAFSFPTNRETVFPSASLAHCGIGGLPTARASGRHTAVVGLLFPFHFTPESIVASTLTLPLFLTVQITSHGCLRLPTQIEGLQDNEFGGGSYKHAAKRKEASVLCFNRLSLFCHWLPRQSPLKESPTITLKH